MGEWIENRGHGHVTPRPDGVLARCGGPALCSVCARELAQKMSLEKREKTPEAEAPTVGSGGKE